MRNYLTKRVLLLIPTVFLVTIMVFLLVRLMPGNVVDIILNELLGMAEGGWTSEEIAEVDRAELEHRLGLDVPMHIQYGRWVGVLRFPDPITDELRYNGLLQGNLGTSLRTNSTVTEEILGRIPVTFELSLLATLIGNAVAIPVGIYSAVRQDTWLDYLGRSFALFSLATPAFWLATMLIVYGSIWWNWSPEIRYIPFSEDPIGNLKMLIIPAILMGTAMSGGLMRLLRTLTLEVLRQDYVRTAWAKGLKERVIIIRHALRNALIPLLGVFVGEIGGLIGGSVIMEQIFNLPGMGRYMLEQLINRDYWVVSGTNLIFTGITMLLILVTDIGYAYVDPRIRYK